MSKEFQVHLQKETVSCKRVIKEETTTEGKDACVLRPSGSNMLVVDCWTFSGGGGRCAWLWCHHLGGPALLQSCLLWEKVLRAGVVYPLTGLPRS